MASRGGLGVASSEAVVYTPKEGEGTSLEPQAFDVFIVRIRTEIQKSPNMSEEVPITHPLAMLFLNLLFGSSSTDE